MPYHVTFADSASLTSPCRPPYTVEIPPAASREDANQLSRSSSSSLSSFSSASPPTDIDDEANRDAAQSLQARAAAYESYQPSRCHRHHNHSHVHFANTTPPPHPLRKSRSWTVSLDQSVPRWQNIWHYITRNRLALAAGKERYSSHTPPVMRSNSWGMETAEVGLVGVHWERSVEELVVGRERFREDTECQCCKRERGGLIGRMKRGFMALWGMDEMKVPAPTDERWEIE